MKQEVKCELYNDNFQNFKRYGIPKAQLHMQVIRHGIRAEIEIMEKARKLIRDFLTVILILIL